MDCIEAPGQIRAAGTATMNVVRSGTQGVRSGLSAVRAAFTAVKRTVVKFLSLVVYLLVCSHIMKMQMVTVNQIEM